MEGRSLIHVLPWGIVCAGGSVVGGCDVDATSVSGRSIVVV